MSTHIEWRYLGTPDSPRTIRVGGQNVSKGACFLMPKEFDFTKEYGSDIRQGLRIARVSPPAEPLKPMSGVYEGWKGEIKKPKKTPFLSEEP